jgi:hypothetical protein
MTSQRDPNRSLPRDYIRREDGSWNALPLVLGALAIAVVGYMLLGDRFTAERPRTSLDRTNTTVPQSTPTQPK